MDFSKTMIKPWSPSLGDPVSGLFLIALDSYLAAQSMVVEVVVKSQVWITYPPDYDPKVDAAIWAEETLKLRRSLILDLVAIGVGVRMLALFLPYRSWALELTFPKQAYLQEVPNHA